MMRTALFLVLSLPTAAMAQSLPATIVARTGQDAAGVPGATYSTVNPLPRLGANGHVAFTASMTGGGVTGFNNQAVWVGTPGNLQIAMRTDAATSGGPMTFSSNTNIGVDANGRVAMGAVLNDLPTQNVRLWSFLPDGNGGSMIVASKGITAAPGFAGGLFDNIATNGMSSNSSGVVAFVSPVNGGDVTGSSNNHGLFTGTPGNLTLVAREGMAAPGATGSAPVFATTEDAGPVYDKRINSTGQIGFATVLSGSGVTISNNRAIYVWTPDGGAGSLALAAQTGNVAPGTSPTIKFSTLDDQPGFNDAGQVAFRGGLASDVPGEIGLLNNFGIWAGAPGNVQLVMRSDTPSPIPGLNFRSSDRNPRINASGQVAFFSLVCCTGPVNNVLWLSTGSDIEAVVREGTPAPGTTANFGTFLPITNSNVALNNAGQVAFLSTLTGAGVTGSNDLGLWAGSPGNLSLVVREGDVIDIDSGPGELLRTVQTISFADGYDNIENSLFESASAAFNDAGQIAWYASFTAASGGGSAVFLTALPEVESGLAGDYNDDGVVDGLDYATWRNHLGEGSEDNIHGNGDGLNGVDEADFDLWKLHYGEVADPPGSGGTAIPEPATFVTLIVALLALAPRRTARRHGEIK